MLTGPPPPPALLSWTLSSAKEQNESHDRSNPKGFPISRLSFRLLFAFGALPPSARCRSAARVQVRLPPPPCISNRFVNPSLSHPGCFPRGVSWRGGGAAGRTLSWDRFLEAAVVSSSADPFPPPPFKSSSESSVASLSLFPGGMLSRSQPLEVDFLQQEARSTHRIAPRVPAYPLPHVWGSCSGVTCAGALLT